MENILEQANKIIANTEDDIDIAKMIEEREKKDTGIRHTTEEVRKRRKKKTSNKTCMQCDWHETFFDDGQSDGCVCNCEKASNEYHINNCMEYITDGDYKGCPYFKDEE